LKVAILARRMSRSWVLISPRLAPERPVSGWKRLGREERLKLLAALAMLLAWFAYTRLYFFLHPRGLTFDPSLFMYLTGKPDPTCGLTRTFAWTWRGDLAQAARVYPLGPVVFVAAVGLLVYLGVAVLTGRRPVIGLPRRVWRTLLVVSFIAVGANWTAKLIWLGM
jgi:Protein of unknown function (DUF2752)